MNPLVPCTSCSRHVRLRECVCPFCRNERGEARGALPASSRIAVSAGILTIATLGIGWNADAGKAPSDAGYTGDAGAEQDAVSPPRLKDDDIRPVPLYGMPPSPRRGC